MKNAGFGTALVIKMMLNYLIVRQLKTTTRVLVILAEQTTPNQMF